MFGIESKLYAGQRRQCQLISPPPPKCSVSCMLLQAIQSQYTFHVSYTNCHIEVMQWQAGWV